MRQQVVSKTLGSATDLTLMVPIRQGMVQEYEAVSYQTRLVALLRTFNSLRSSTREQQLAPAFTDPVERIEQIHNFRLAITDTRPARLILAVTFDHHWEPYMRVIWRELGPLLDPMLCNVEGYPLAAATDYEPFIAWVRKWQQSTEYFFNATSLTVSDLNYLMQSERIQRDGRQASGVDLDIARFSSRTPQLQLAEARRTGPVVAGEVVRQGVSALLGLFALTRYYGATPALIGSGAHTTPNDAMLLLRGARLILDSFDTRKLPGAVRNRLAGPIAWYEQDVTGLVDTRTFPALDRKMVQKGILTAFGDGPTRVTHGVVLMFEIVDPGKARAWLAGFNVSSEAEVPADGIFRSVAFGLAGLDRLGIAEKWRDAFPQEFKEGSRARAPQLGDLRSFHPRAWKLPKRNWPVADEGEIQLETIDVIIQLRTCAPTNDDAELGLSHPLFAEVTTIGNADTGLRLLGVQTMLTATADTERDHFGSRDGISQPVPGPARGDETYWSDAVPYGDFVLGQPGDHRSPRSTDEFRTGGSFLVIRKMRQYRARFDSLLARIGRETSLSRGDFLAKVIGRESDGTPLVPNAGINDFDYRSDPHGSSCPLQSHVRRANPRDIDVHAKPPPRLMRRGMSYGPRLTTGDSGAERGLVFMAYCASIAEQFEVVQRWVNGGNSTRIGSFHGDPLIGVPKKGDPRTFRFESARSVERVALNSDDMPPVELEWTGYFFAPAIDVLRSLDRYTCAPDQPEPPPKTPEELGEAIIAGLRALERLDPAAAPGQWQTVLDDAGARSIGTTANVWAAIRSGHGGALTCPYGETYARSPAVLVADAAGFGDVLDTARGNYSVCGYDDRASATIGSIYLGYDADDERYDATAKIANGAIEQIGFADAFALAFGAGRQVLGAILKPMPERGGPVSLQSDYVDNVLAELCRKYFDVPDGDDGRIVRGGLDWRRPGSGRKPHCPGDYYSPSRFIFDPTPSAVGEKYGIEHGQALRAATLALKQSGHAFVGRISQVLATRLTDDDLFARTHVGVMMGFLPTVTGNMIGVLDQWLTSGELWRLQSALLAGDWTAKVEAATALGDLYPQVAAGLDTPLRQAMQQRPAPDFIWRTATANGTIGGESVVPGQVVALSIYSATFEAAAKEKTAMPPTGPDVFAIFGGDRAQTGHPQHACPGYKMAMGTMLGLLAALLTDCSIRPLSGQLLVEISRRR